MEVADFYAIKKKCTCGGDHSCWRCGGSEVFFVAGVAQAGKPCRHPGCLAHVTHPCEVCGRVAGQSLPRGWSGQAVHVRDWVRLRCSDGTLEGSEGSVVYTEEWLVDVGVERIPLTEMWEVFYA